MQARKAEAMANNQDGDRPEPVAGPSGGAPPPRNMRDTWWPRVNTPAEAARASRHGFWAAVINVILTATIFFIALGGGNLRGIPLTQDAAILSGIEAALFLPIAWGLWRHSWIAAAAALVFYCASEVAAGLWLKIWPDTFATLLVVCFLVFFTHGLRGSFALSRMARAGTQPEPPST